MYAAVIVLAVLCIYSPVCQLSFPAGWLWDDDDMLTENRTIRSTTLQALASLWLWSEEIDYFPLTQSALWLQWAIFGTWSTGYHVTSVLLHASASILVWRLFSMLGISAPWLGAALFAIHPVCVESVAWVAEIKNTLSAPLIMLSAISFLRSDSVPARTLESRRHYILSLCFFLLAMLAKTAVVAWPVVLLAHAWWARGVVTRRDLARAIPFFCISLALGSVTIAMQHERAIGYEVIPIGGTTSRIAVAGLAILFYLKLILWPVYLLPMYPRWEVGLPALWQFLPWIAIVAATAACWIRRGSWGRHALFGMMFFLVMVSPVLGFVTMSYMRISWVADHFIYIPMIGPLALIAASAGSAYSHLSRASRRWGVVGVVVTFGALGWLSFCYASKWVSEEALWTYTLGHNDNAWNAHNRLGALKLDRDFLDDVEPVSSVADRGALYHFERASTLRPDLGETLANFGLALCRKNRWNEGVTAFEGACRAAPHAIRFRLDLATALASAGRLPEAETTLQDLIAAMEAARDETMRRTGGHTSPINPGYASLLYKYGVVVLKQKRKDEAAVAFRKALAANPNLEEARVALALAMEPDTAPRDSATKPGAR